jgi:ferredoxin
MPFLINAGDCISCGVCEPVCPNGGISKDPDGSAYVIAADRCTECVGFFAIPRCTAVCPMDCCVLDPRNRLTEAALFERAKAAHQDGAERPRLTEQTSRFRKPAPAKWWARLLPFATRATAVAADDVTPTGSSESTSYA